MMAGPKTLMEVLWGHLENLSEKDYKHFKFILSEFPFDDKPSVAWGKLEKAPRTDVAILLRRHYGMERAVDATIKVFKRINRRDLAAKLQEEKDTGKKSKAKCGSIRGDAHHWVFPSLRLSNGCCCLWYLLACEDLVLINRMRDSIPSGPKIPLQVGVIVLVLICPSIVSTQYKIRACPVKC